MGFSRSLEKFSISGSIAVQKEPRRGTKKERINGGIMPQVTFFFRNFKYTDNNKTTPIDNIAKRCLQEKDLQLLNFETYV